MPPTSILFVMPTVIPAPQKLPALKTSSNLPLRDTRAHVDNPKDHIYGRVSLYWSKSDQLSPCYGCRCSCCSELNLSVRLDGHYVYLCSKTENMANSENGPPYFPNQKETCRAILESFYAKPRCLCLHRTRKRNPLCLGNVIVSKPSHCNYFLK